MKAHHFIIAVAAMAAIIAGSNYLLQFPVHATLGGINLADLLIYAAFTFPVAFLVTDLTNKLFGPAAADEGTICKAFAESIEANSVHGSDSPKNAAIEIKQNFTDAEIVG